MLKGLGVRTTKSLPRNLLDTADADESLSELAEESAKPSASGDYPLIHD
jgi:hypothetical protein